MGLVPGAFGEHTRSSYGDLVTAMSGIHRRGRNLHGYLLFAGSLFAEEVFDKGRWKYGYLVVQERAGPSLRHTERRPPRAAPSAITQNGVVDSGMSSRVRARGMGTLASRVPESKPQP